MTYHAILAASVFLLLAFAIERIGRVSGIPSVVLLIAVGLAGKPALSFFGLEILGIDAAVPLIGTIGLVLIVLEGALDIELRKERLKAATGAFLIATIGFLACTAAFTVLALHVLHLSLFQATLLSVPFAVISSAVAIPGSSFLSAKGREFVVYESSLSDIIGVLVFFSLFNSDGSLMGALKGLIGGGLLSLILGAICAIGLVLVLMRVDGHIRFIPLLAGLFGLYAAGELMHLSPLILVLLFGLAINNPRLITRFKPFSTWSDNCYDKTLTEFKTLTNELTFAVRGYFFILLGYWTELSDLVSPRSWLTAGIILSIVFAIRYLLLKAIHHEDGKALLWLAPRGLITVLLFLAARNAMPLPHYIEGSVMLVVLVSAILLAISRLRHAPGENEANGNSTRPDTGEDSNTCKSP